VSLPRSCAAHDLDANPAGSKKIYVFLFDPSVTLKDLYSGDDALTTARGTILTYQFSPRMGSVQLLCTRNLPC
jgi:hypothetical protein